MKPCLPCAAIIAATTIFTLGALVSQADTQPDKKPMPAGGTSAPKPPAPPTGQPPMSPEMAAMMKAAMPSEHHQVLDAFVGTWNGEVSFIPGPGAPPQTSSGTMSSSWQLGKRWLRQEWKGSMMNMPFEGLGYFGFDNTENKYVGTWMDTMSTGCMMNKGSYDSASKTFTMIGSATNPQGKVETYRQTLKIDSPDKHTMQMFDTTDPKNETLLMTIVYTRVKK
jgi:hypothetical protein